MDLDKEKQIKPIDANDKSYEALVQENFNLSVLLDEWDTKLVKAGKKIKRLKRILSTVAAALLD